jgi:hypothetical protein
VRPEGVNPFHRHLLWGDLAQTARHHCARRTICGLQEFSEGLQPLQLIYGVGDKLTLLFEYLLNSG